MKLTTAFIAALALTLSACNMMKKETGPDNQTTGTGMHSGAGMKPKTSMQTMNMGASGSGEMPTTPPMTGRTTAVSNH